MIYMTIWNVHKTVFLWYEAKSESTGCVDWRIKVGDIISYSVCYGGMEYCHGIGNKRTKCNHVLFSFGIGLALLCLSLFGVTKVTKDIITNVP